MPRQKRYKYALCRSRMPGHDWQSGASGSTWQPESGFGEEEQCTRCYMIRRAIMSIFGRKTPWMYDNIPDDYATDLTMDELRLMAYQELHPDAKIRKPPKNVIPLGGRSA